MIDGKTGLLGVIGYPVKHSLSPTMHNAAIAHLNVNYVYLPLPVHPDALEAAIAGFKAIGLEGFNVTIPHKQAILPYLMDVSDLARAVGAVNTVYRTDQGWMGTNTDVEGFLAPLRSQASTLAGSTALVLGNGGAARAVVAGCTQLGVGTIQVVGRDPQKLEQFQASWADSPLAKGLEVHPWEDMSKLLPQARLIVNTTPIGMHTDATASPLSLQDWELMPGGAIAYDLIYIPRPTRFLQDAAAHGLTTIDGTEMLVNQGAAALELWLGQAAPVDVMRHALLSALA
ncbi:MULTISPECIES: shikimate dehydrogenase [unclassified Leptolyngbya]|uniref:shikimate dehydrogenase n=1 Tax=unclassified Leptolyngbya TaxID=2650499 RepID=UPI001682E957|nr:MULTISPECIES: shikimate dehydrogenase [unclassified Leptolyngbya]MBD1911020.1 shikimate dehydrogenase [Leptolyngbya sp. FACHB-8]MBD2158314.1 shikimate dehydrogenase [Leptolyngbya sp. FACHB-16]